MSTQDNAATDSQTDQAEEDRLFYEVAGEGDTGPAEPGTEEPDNLDEAGDDTGEDDTPRDDQGRFASGDDDPGTQDDGHKETFEQELERLRQEAQQWQHRYQSDLGRQNALQRKIQQLEDENRKFQQHQASGKGQQEGDASGDNPDGSGMSDADWQALKEDFPEIAKGIEQQMAQVTQRYESQLQELKSQITPIQERAAEQQTQAEIANLSDRHPDWQQTVQTPDFMNWLQQQPADVQKLTDSPYAADAAFLLDSFKAITGMAKPGSQQAPDRQRRNQRRLQSAQSVPSRGGRQRSDIPEGDEDALFDYFANKD